MTRNQASYIATMATVLVALALLLLITGCKTDNPTPRPSYPKSAVVAPTPTRTTTAPVQATRDPFSSCAEARDADAAPLNPDHPRWNPKLDRDHDGSACE